MERNEHDMLGARAIPEDSYTGIHTLRARENFDLAGRAVSLDLVRAMAVVKKACAAANWELKYLDEPRARAIFQACDEIAGGGFAGELSTDALQGGAGTSTNLNLDEVIANRALELLGRSKGDYAFLSPLDTVNLHQSTNDVYPTALKVAAIGKVRRLAENLAVLQGALQQKETEFADVVKLGRTEMQPAIPMTLGAEFSAYAEAFARDRWRTFKCEERLRIVNLGGTAVGTGMAAPRRYIFLVIEKLREFTRYGLSRAENCVDQTANADVFVEVAGILNAAAANFMKVCRDLRQLHSLGEIQLPARQAGSSIMPGKVNPVVLEAVIQGAMLARSKGALVGECAGEGTLQINEFMPLLADSLLTELDLLERMSALLAAHVAEIEVSRERCLALLDAAPTVITAFLPYLGYEKALELAEAFRLRADRSEGLRAFLRGKIDPGLVERVLRPQSLTALGFRDE
ncbi:MAG: lyase family protein [Victivallaceae bacterium]|nr:lyase family protein [Victivallaceae bacterium]